MVKSYHKYSKNKNIPGFYYLSLRTDFSEKEIQKNQSNATYLSVEIVSYVFKEDFEGPLVVNLETPNIMVVDSAIGTCLTAKNRKEFSFVKSNKLNPLKLGKDKVDLALEEVLIPPRVAA